MWRVGLGPLINATHPTTGRIMILGTRGRSSGQTRWTPLNYSPGEGMVWCTAGFGTASDWLRNLEAHPQVEVWLPRGRWRGQAEVVTDEAEVLVGLRRVLSDSGFAARLFAHIDPAIISDDDLRQQTRDYRLVRIQLGEAVDPGPHFPWQAALAVGLAVGYWLGRRLPSGDRIGGEF